MFPFLQQFQQKLPTHVAGIACGNGYASSGVYQGIAPFSHIVALKILDQNGQGNSTKAILALQWIMDNATKYNIKVVNLSIGTNDRKVNQPLLEAVNALWHRGITVVAASGNPDSKGTFFPSPAISPKIITVGAWEDKYLYDDSLQSQSIFQKKSLQPDIWAPGEQIVSVLSPDYCFTLQNRSTSQIVAENYITMSGTSMATPMVSGTVLLLLEQFPKLSPDEIKNRILWASRYGTTPQKKGLLNIDKTLHVRKVVTT